MLVISWACHIIQRRLDCHRYQTEGAGAGGATATHSFLCLFQSAFWHATPQYLTERHLVHMLRPPAMALLLPQVRHCSASWPST